MRSACGSCGKLFCVFQGAVGAFFASTAPAASTGASRLHPRPGPSIARQLPRMLVVLHPVAPRMIGASRPAGRRRRSGTARTGAGGGAGVGGHAPRCAISVQRITRSRYRISIAPFGALKHLRPCCAPADGDSAARAASSGCRYRTTQSFETVRVSSSRNTGPAHAPRGARVKVVGRAPGPAQSARCAPPSIPSLEKRIRGRDVAQCRDAAASSPADPAACRDCARSGPWPAASSPE